MTTKEYIKYRYNDNYKSECQEFNKELCKKYPWLIPSNRWSGKKITDCEGEDGKEGYWPDSPESHPDFDWSYTELDEMPDGWRIAFGDKMCEEIHNELVKFDFVDDFQILQIKEKFGGLRFYTGGIPAGKLAKEYEEFTKLSTELFPDDRDEYVYEYQSTDSDIQTYHKRKILQHCNIHNIIDKYEDLSYKICVKCGKPATQISTGWICPWCDDCAKEVHDNLVPIDRYFEDMTD